MIVTFERSLLPEKMATEKKEREREKINKYQCKTNINLLLDLKSRRYTYK